MKYVEDPEKLANIMTSLATHEPEVRRFFLAALTPRITAAHDPEDKLLRLFVLANADRVSTGKENENLVKATATFREYQRQDIIGSLAAMTPSDAHEHLLTSLCDIKGMDQKTANLFLKLVVISHDDLNLSGTDWRLWEPHLHVPLDLWVLRLIGKNYLNVCGTDFEADFQYKGDYPSPSVKTGRYRHLQDDIKQVATSANVPPIVLDSLWFVGSHYCSYHPLLCDICWIREYCLKYETVDWNQVPVTLKSAELEERKHGIKVMRQLEGIWESENPHKTADDFLEFIRAPEGQEWLSKHLRR